MTYEDILNELNQYHDMYLNEVNIEVKHLLAKIIKKLTTELYEQADWYLKTE